VSDLVGYLMRAIGLPAAFGAVFVVIPLALGERAKLGRFALAGVAFAILASLAVEIGSPALVRSLPAGLGEAWGDASLAPERWHQVAFVAMAVLVASMAGLFVGRAVSEPWTVASRFAVGAIAVVAAATVAFAVRFPGEDARRELVEFAVALAAIGGIRVLSRADVRRPSGPAGLGGGIVLWGTSALLGILAALFLLVPFPSLAVASAAGGFAALLMAAVSGWVAIRRGQPVIDGAGLASVGFGILVATLAFAGLAYGRDRLPEWLWLAVALAPWAGVAATPIARACVHAPASIAWRLAATAAVPLAFAAPHLAREFLPASDETPPAAVDPMEGIYGDLGADPASN
jgi:hypothetical protein